jgi:hypothetical protein
MPSSPSSPLLGAALKKPEFILILLEITLDLVKALYEVGLSSPIAMRLAF